MKIMNRVDKSITGLIILAMTLTQGIPSGWSEEVPAGAEQEPAPAQAVSVAQMQATEDNVVSPETVDASTSFLEGEVLIDENIAPEIHVVPPTTEEIKAGLMDIIRLRQGTNSSQGSFDPNFDLNNSRTITTADLTLMRLFFDGELSVEQHNLIAEKITNAIRSRVPAQATDANYLPGLDMNRDSVINIGDVLAWRQIATNLLPTTGPSIAPVVISDVTTNSVTLSANIVYDPAVPLANQQVVVLYKVSGAADWSGAIIPPGNIDATTGFFSQLLTGLNPGTNYQYQVAIENIANLIGPDLAASSIATFTTQTLPVEAGLVQAGLMDIIRLRQGTNSSQGSFDPNFDLNNSRTITTADLTLMRLFFDGKLNVEQHNLIAEKITNAIRSRVPANATDANYLPGLDMNRDNVINIGDVLAWRQIAPMIIATVEHRNVTGTTAVIEAQVDQNYLWDINNRNIYLNYRVQGTEEWKQAEKTTKDETTFVFGLEAPNDTGLNPGTTYEYQVVGPKPEEPWGEMIPLSQIQSFTTLAKAVVISGITVAETTSTTALISGSIENFDPNTMRAVLAGYLSDSGGTAGAFSPELVVENGVFTVKLENLLPEQKYLYWVFVDEIETNLDLGLAFIEPQTFVTESVEIATVEHRNVTGTTAVIEAQVDQNYLWDINNRNIYLNYRVQGTEEWKQAEKTTKDETTFVFGLEAPNDTGLNPGTTYEYQVVGPKPEEPWGEMIPLSQIQSFTTLAKAVVISGITVAETTSTTALISGSIENFDPNTMRAVLAGYLSGSGGIGGIDAGAFTPELVVENGVFTMKLENLLPEKEYLYWVFVDEIESNLDLTLAYTEPQTFVTEPQVIVIVEPPVSSIDLIKAGLMDIIRLRQGTNSSQGSFDPNFDLNNSRTITTADLTLMRLFFDGKLNVEQHNLIAEKITNAIRSRVPANATDANYLPGLDMNRDNVINIGDVLAWRQIALKFEPVTLLYEMPFGTGRFVIEKVKDSNGNDKTVAKVLGPNGNALAEYEVKSWQRLTADRTTVTLVDNQELTVFPQGQLNKTQLINTESGTLQKTQVFRLEEAPLLLLKQETLHELDENGNPTRILQEWQYYHDAQGNVERTTLHRYLPDGSLVWINRTAAGDQVLIYDKNMNPIWSSKINDLILGTNELSGLVFVIRGRDEEGNRIQIDLGGDSVQLIKTQLINTESGTLQKTQVFRLEEVPLLLLKQETLHQLDENGNQTRILQEWGYYHDAQGSVERTTLHRYLPDGSLVWISRTAAGDQVLIFDKNMNRVWGQLNISDLSLTTNELSGLVLVIQGYDGEGNRIQVDLQGDSPVVS